jgi:hypothetical protein
MHDKRTTMRMTEIVLEKAIFHNTIITKQIKNSRLVTVTK